MILWHYFVARKKKAPNPITFAKTVLRGAFRKWYAGNEAAKRCRVARGQYKCEGCGQVMKRKDLQIDHIKPVVDIKTGFTDLEDWVMRLLVPPEELQMLCFFKDEETGESWGCHSSKTASENAMREFYKTKKKGKKK